MEPGLAFIHYTYRRRSIALARVVGVSGQERAGHAGGGPASHRERYEKDEQATHCCLPTPEMLNNSFRRAVTRVALRMLAARSGSPPLVGEVREGVVSRRRASVMLYERWRWTLRSRFVGG